jgi:fatty acid-binding protein DegV
MKYVVIVDSMSNMPEHVLKTRGNIKVVPLNTQIGGKTELDLLDTERLNQFYKDNPLTEGAKADATSPTPEQMSVFLVNEIAPYYDCAIFQSTSAALSDVFKSIKECAETIENDARAVRKMAGISEPFKLIVSNSGNSSSGQTLLALYTDALLHKGVAPETAVENADRFKKNVKTYSVISDMMQARTRMKMVGHKTISMTSAVSGQLQRNAPLVSLCNDEFKINHLKISYAHAIKSLFEHAEGCIENGLYLPIIYVSYAGMIRNLHDMKEFQSLQNKAKTHGVKVISAMMSVSACINYSTGSISLGIVPKDKAAEPA